MSPITEIFGGELRSAVHRQGAKESAIVEPFFSLQLDIQVGAERERERGGGGGGWERERENNISEWGGIRCEGERGGAGERERERERDRERKKVRVQRLTSYFSLFPV